ncbi:hypothetical protein TcWFU_002971 [Taenia crassiceps]|uniref:Deoxyribonuclease TATDN1 n=1 Tax=Taenia crassiceps TaxID=6207 RepID=A0ABR4QKQ9_9CEST
MQGRLICMRPEVKATLSSLRRYEHTGFDSRVLWIQHKNHTGFVIFLGSASALMSSRFALRPWKLSGVTASRVRGRAVESHLPYLSRTYVFGNLQRVAETRARPRPSAIACIQPWNREDHSNGREDIIAAKELCCTDPRLYYTIPANTTWISKAVLLKVGLVWSLSANVVWTMTDIQLSCFQKLLNLASECKLPLFLHCRNAFEDLISGIRKHVDRCGPIHGVVHTFDGTEEQAEAIIELGLYIGFNGCSLKTERNLEVVASVPSERILLETDAPWCEIRPTHAGFRHVVTKFAKKKPNRWESGCMVAGRNEPANIVQVLEVVAGARGQLPDELAHAAYENTLSVFPSLLTS